MACFLDGPKRGAVQLRKRETMSMLEAPIDIFDYYDLQHRTDLYSIDLQFRPDVSAVFSRAYHSELRSYAHMRRERWWKPSLTTSQLAEASVILGSWKGDIADFQAFCEKGLSLRHDTTRSITETALTDEITTYLWTMTEILYLDGRVALSHGHYSRAREVFYTLFLGGDKVCRLCTSDLRHHAGLFMKQLAHDLLWECLGMEPSRRLAEDMVEVIFGTPPDRICFALCVSESVLLEVDGLLGRMASTCSPSEYLSGYLGDDVTDRILPSYVPSGSGDGQLAIDTMNLLGIVDMQEKQRLIDDRRRRHQIFSNIFGSAKQVLDISETRRVLMYDARAFLGGVERTLDALRWPYSHAGKVSYNQWPSDLRLDRYCRSEDCAVTTQLDCISVKERISKLENPLGALIAGDAAVAINCCLNNWVDSNWTAYCIDYALLRTFGRQWIEGNEPDAVGVIVDVRRNQGAMSAVAGKRLGGGTIQEIVTIPPSWR